MNIHLSIRNIKNIRNADMELPFEKGVYAIVGENGCGKSTIMLALSLMIKRSSTRLFSDKDFLEDSSIFLEVDNKSDSWKEVNKRLATGKYKDYRGHKVVDSSISIKGFYEGSIFFGTRFDDYNLIDSFMTEQNLENYLIEADSFVKETLGYILHNDKHYYQQLKKIKSKEIAEGFRFKGMPYFLRVNNTYISQYRMSSGESMLISLIDFINNLVIRNPNSGRLLFLIDEVELALHPSAIDRLMETINNLINNAKAELVVYFSTHSAELLHRINNRNIFLLENNSGIIDCINPCYPNYAIRNLYVPNGFDFLLLVEDALAKALVEKTIRDNKLGTSKLICVLPAGGWSQMIKLHRDMITYNTLGIGKKIISIFDGDVESEVRCNKEYKAFPKCFLPIPSIEKYLKKKLIDLHDIEFTKHLGDQYFTQKSIKEILQDYKNDSRIKKGDNAGKILYQVLCTNLKQNGIPEEQFVQYLCGDIFQFEDISKFAKNLSDMLQ